MLGQVVLDLVIEAAQSEVGEESTMDIARSQDLAAQEVQAGSGLDDRHALVSRGERAAHIWAPHGLVHAEERDCLHRRHDEQQQRREQRRVQQQC